PSSSGSRTAACTGVSVVKPRRASAAAISGPTSGSNRAGSGTLVASSGVARSSFVIRDRRCLTRDSALCVIHRAPSARPCSSAPGRAGNVGAQPPGGGRRHMLGAVDGFQGTSRFVVEARLGEGGMGVVHQVRDVERGEIVALKTM